MTIKVTQCQATYEDFAYYTYGLTRKSICTKCGKNHFRLSLKDKLIQAGILSLIPVTIIGICISARLAGCFVAGITWESCWSPF